MIWLNANFRLLIFSHLAWDISEISTWLTSCNLLAFSHHERNQRNQFSGHLWFLILWFENFLIDFNCETFIEHLTLQTDLNFDETYFWVQSIDIFLYLSLSIGLFLSLSLLLFLSLEKQSETVANSLAVGQGQATKWI